MSHSAEKKDHEAEMNRVGIKTFIRICNFWQLDDKIAAELIDVEAPVWYQIKSGNWTGALTDDQMMRVSALIGIYKGLHERFGEELANRWPTLPNNSKPFMGKSPVDYMTNGGFFKALEARDYVDNIRNGM